MLHPLYKDAKKYVGRNDFKGEKWLKSPDSANPVIIEIGAAALAPITEILDPRIVVIVLRRTPIVGISKTANLNLIKI